MIRKLLAVCLSAVVLVAAAPKAEAIDIRRVVTPGGIVAWFVPDESVPLLSVSFAFGGVGSATDPDGKEGLAEMTAALLDEGAGDLSSQDFQRALEEIAAQLAFDASRDTFGGNLRTLTSERARAFELLRVALTVPRFDAEPVERMRSEIIASLRQESENPRRIAGDMWNRTMFPGHPYGKPSGGTAESIARIGLDDLRSFVRGRLARDRLVIGVVGDIAEADLVRHLDEVFGGLPPKATVAAVPDVAPVAGARTLVVRKPIPQSVIVLGHGGIKRDDPDWYAASLVTRIFGGGGFSSRLYEEIREKRGLAYSVYAYLHPMDHAGLVVGGTATQNARASESLRLIREEWSRLVRDGVTAEELRDAKTYVNGSFPLRLNSSRRIARMLVAVQRADLGIDYLNDRPRLINAVTLEQANAVARRLYRPDELTVIVVGDPEGIKQTAGN